MQGVGKVKEDKASRVELSVVVMVMDMNGLQDNRDSFWSDRPEGVWRSSILQLMDQ